MGRKKEGVFSSILLYVTHFFLIIQVPPNENQPGLPFAATKSIILPTDSDSSPPHSLSHNEVHAPDAPDAILHSKTDEVENCLTLEPASDTENSFELWKAEIQEREKSISNGSPDHNSMTFGAHTQSNTKVPVSDDSLANVKGKEVKDYSVDFINNYASIECGAQMMASNPELKNRAAVLKEVFLFC